jgi:predicted HTH domain antitoxin
MGLNITMWYNVVKGQEIEMPVTIDLPEDIEHQLEAQWGNLPRRALEALAIEGYRHEALSAGQVAEMLGLSTWEIESFLKQRGVELHYTSEDLREDVAAAERALSE